MNRNLVLASMMVLASACTEHGRSRDTEARADVVASITADVSFLWMSAEDKQEFAHREQQRAVQRRLGLRTCDEGEHGTTWQEDCMWCRCENGRRSCPAVHCTHARRQREQLMSAHRRSAEPSRAQPQPSSRP
jgi:hypothetical protein